MYIHVWKKYLSIIRILMKKAAEKAQTLDMNRIDFERAGSGRKAGYKFTIEIRQGRVVNVISGSPLALDLASVLLQEKAIKDLLAQNDYLFHFNTRFQLSIEQAERPAELQETDSDAKNDEKLHSGE